LKREYSELQCEGHEPSSFHKAPAVVRNNGEGREIFVLPAFSPQQTRYLGTSTILDATFCLQHFPDNTFHSDITGFFQLKCNQIKSHMI